MVDLLHKLIGNKLKIYPTVLRKLLDTFTENLSALKNFNFPVDEWDFVLVMIMLKRLDNNTVTRFEMEHCSTEVPKYQTIMDFLNKRCIALDTLSFSYQLSFKKSYQKSSGANFKTN